MKLIKDTEFGGERPLFESHDLRLENVIIRAGESAIKECSNIEAFECRFEGNYPFWHVHGFKIDRCYFDVGGRSALWYCDHLKMTDTIIDAPKMFREMDGIELCRVRIPDAQETLWHCRNVVLEDVELSNADYLFMHSENIRIDRYRQQGNYSFQYCRNVEIRNSRIDSKDAFWNTENVTVYDSELNGEYLGWHSKNLRLVNCHISGEQPLCYAHHLILENCTFDPGCDRAFEYSTLQADIRGAITNIKNPMSGRIVADEIGSVTIDENIKAPADCRIERRKKQTLCNTILTKSSPATAPIA